MISPRRRIVAGRVWWRQSLGGLGLRRMRELDLDTHALALCAQQVLCTAPLIVAMSSVLQRVNGRGISSVISRFFGLHGQSADYVQRIFGRASESISTMALVFGLITAVVFTTSVAAVQQRGFELIWNLPRRSGMGSYLRQLAWTPGLAVFCAALLGATKLAKLLDAQIDGAGIWTVVVLQGLATFLFYWWTQHWLLGGRVEWTPLLAGSLAVGVSTSVLVRLSRVIMPGQISWQVHAYGLIGAVFVLSIWMMISSVVIFAGVLFGALRSQRRFDPRRSRRGQELKDSPLTPKGQTSAARGQDQTTQRGEQTLVQKEAAGTDARDEEAAATL